MDRKIRTYPPIIVSSLTALIWLVAAFGEISSRASLRTEGNEAVTLGELPPTPTEAVLSASQIILTAEEQPESAYASMMGSRDWSGEDSEILLKIAMAEAEGESTEGKALVMLVVLNRVGSDKFPDTVEDVVFQPKQFSPVMEGGRYYTTEPDEDCYKALELVTLGWDKSYGALYFENCGEDSWHSKNLEFLYQAGKHKFYR